MNYLKASHVVKSGRVEEALRRVDRRHFVDHDIPRRFIYQVRLHG